MTAHAATMFIDGKSHEPVSGEGFPTVDPSSGRVICEVASGTVPDVDVAVEAARRAFDDRRWSGQTPARRKRRLLAFADLIENHATELAELDAREGGKPVSASVQTDLPDSVDAVRWYAELCDKMYDDVAPTGDKALGLVRREPVGVVGAVIPWNYPVYIAAFKVAPALAAGNSVVLKPSELTSLSALRLAELACEAGLPDGVFNVVTGFGDIAGAAIGKHRGIDAVSFTGSTEVGRLFLTYASQSNLKRISLECGGKSAQIVLPDAGDLGRVAQHAAVAAFANMGENCSCGSRLIVHRSLHDDLVGLVAREARSMTVGGALEVSTQVGPLITSEHMAKVLSYVQNGIDEGGEIVCGGERVLQETGGYFVTPTVFAGVPTGAKMMREEIFGPVVAAIPFDTEDEAVQLANDTSYGLAASVWTGSLDAAFRVAGAVRAGVVSVNCYSEGDITVPFGGYKESGFGGRDKGREALYQYTELKTIWFDLNR